jgi:hypothetical protein
MKRALVIWSSSFIVVTATWYVLPDIEKGVSAASSTEKAKIYLAASSLAIRHVTNLCYHLSVCHDKNMLMTHKLGQPCSCSELICRLDSSLVECPPGTQAAGTRFPAATNLSRGALLNVKGGEDPGQDPPYNFTF